MSKFNFEKLHRSRKLVFLDGLLTGALTAYLAMKLWEEYREDKTTHETAGENFVDPNYMIVDPKM